MSFAYLRCNVNDLVSGFVLIDNSTKIYEIVSFANSIAATGGGIANLVYNASFASINRSNIDKSIADITGTAYFNESAASLKQLGSPAFRKDAYGFCTYPCKGIIVIDSYDGFNSVVNGDHYSISRGSCNDSTGVSEAAWCPNVSTFLCSRMSICMNVCLSICPYVSLFFSGVVDISIIQSICVLTNLILSDMLMSNIILIS